jgi:hypothetical protein
LKLRLLLLLRHLLLTLLLRPLLLLTLLLRPPLLLLTLLLLPLLLLLRPSNSRAHMSTKNRPSGRFFYLS